MDRCEPLAWPLDLLAVRPQDLSPRDDVAATPPLPARPLRPAPRSLADVLEGAARLALREGGVASCSISAFDASGTGALRTIVNVGELGPDEVARPRDEHYPLAGFPRVAAVLRQQRGYVVAVDDRDADRASVALLEALGKHSQVGVPLLRDGEVWGELWCASSTRLTVADLPHFYRVAAEVSALVAATRRAGLLLAPERVDALTGLADEVALRKHLQELAGGDGPAAAALVVGELERHPGAGSAELEGLADVLRELADPEAGDLVARVGPAQAAVLLPARDEPAASALAAVAVADLALRHPAARLRFGVAATTDLPRDHATLLDRAAHAATHAASVGRR
jgi:GGDEF domain-containing protein